ncbi:MAG: hypothetical protein ACODAU_03100 [Myxococcota bacterium]
MMRASEECLFELAGARTVQSERTECVTEGAAACRARIVWDA